MPRSGARHGGGGRVVERSDVADGDRARYAALVRAVRRNVGHAHGVRGMNACTMLALRDAASDDDVHLLQRMLDDRDRVAALTALYVLATMGDAGVAAVKTRRSPRP